MTEPTASKTSSRAEACRDKRDEAGDVALPILERGPDGAAIRSSKSGKWRAFSLLMVHVLILAHVGHWLYRGRTLTPIEPSESMETIRTGQINAGFVFFGVAILLTMVLGRFVCGWACHLVAYQDLMLWILKKLHLRPKAFRSRLLVYVPALGAFYMFFLPAIYRAVMGLPHPELKWHLMRAGFWDTFPEYGIAILTVLFCGMAIVYFLGAKGFCTYACPYGALFGAADRLAVGRIRVTDACHSCGHCTAVCSSNVDVAREVKLHGMVVDPGCMKCLDCVSVCPNEALYVGFGAPSLLTPSPRRYDYTLLEEVWAALLFTAAFLSFRGLYGKVPFLFSLGLAGIASFVLMKATQLFYSRDVFLQRIRLKLDGRLQGAGVWYAAGSLLLAAFTAHCGYWRYHDFQGQMIVATLPSDGLGWQRDPVYFGDMSAEELGRARAALAHLMAADRWGFAHPVDNEVQLGWLELMTGATEQAAQRFRRLAESHPDDAGFWMKWANTETFLKRYESARTVFALALEIDQVKRERIRRKLPDEPLPESAQVWTEWGMFLADRGELAAARAALNDAVKHDPTSTLAWLALGSFQYSEKEYDAARASLIRSVSNGPDNRRAVEILEKLSREEQNFPAAISEYEQALAAHPDQLVFLHNLAHSLARSGRYAEAVAKYRELLAINPKAVGVRAEMGATMMASGDLAGATAEYERVAESLPDDDEALLKLGVLYRETGRIGDALAKFEIVAKKGGPLAETARNLIAQVRKP